MTSIEQHQQIIEEFESHYQYDSTYMKDLLKSSPAAYQLFADFLPLAHHREHLSVEDYWLVRISAMQVADCGACLQLNIKMAQEQGLSSTLILSVLNDDELLSPQLKQLRSYAQQLVLPAGVDDALMKTMRSRYNYGQLLEFGICVATTVVFPTIKRAIGATQSCVITDIAVA